MGIVSTVVSLIFIALFILLAIWAAANPDEYHTMQKENDTPTQKFEGSRT